MEIRTHTPERQAHLFDVSALRITDKAIQPHEPKYRAQEQALNLVQTLDFLLRCRYALKMQDRQSQQRCDGCVERRPTQRQVRIATSTVDQLMR